MASNNMTFEQQVVELTNQERAKNNLPALKENAELNYVADEYAKQMSERRVLSHTGADGSLPWERAEAIGYEAKTMGENIGAGQTTPEQVVQDWMNSPGHRENILNPKYTEIGTGFHNNYWSQEFGSGDLNPISKIPNPPSSEATLQVNANDSLIGDVGENKLVAGFVSDRLMNNNTQNQEDITTDFAPHQYGRDLRHILTEQAHSSPNQFCNYLKPQQIGADSIGCPDVFEHTKFAGFDQSYSSVMPNLDASELNISNKISQNF
ncbi:MAG: CAP domain-containing protein [Fischerella sp. CENA71]|nr:CAP domain-containing protein [Fischerella sp. CENA71]